MCAPLDCSTIIFRTITRAADLGPDDRPLASAFMRRANDDDGLSVDYNVEVPDGCAPQLTGKRAIFSLHVGKLRDLEVEVVPDTENHALIRVPPHEDLEAALQVAAELAQLARLRWKRPGGKGAKKTDEGGGASDGTSAR